MEGSLVAYKVFTNGSVLNASEINDNLMNQAVMVFSNSTARSAALPAPVEGMLTWLEDVNRYEYRSGAGTWLPLVPATSSGLEFISTQNFTAQATVSFNSVFTSAYKNYKIILNIDSAGNSPTAVRMRLRASGADNTTSNYRVGRLFVGAFNSEPSNNVNAATQTYFDLGGANQVLGGSSVIHVLSPQIAQNTKISALNAGQLAEIGGGGFALTTAFDGFTILLNTTTITGSCTVYGLKDS